MQCKKRNGNNLKNEMTIKILVNYFFSKINILSPRNTENDNLQNPLKSICEFDLNISFQQLFYDCFITHIIRTDILVFKHFT